MSNLRSQCKLLLLAMSFSACCVSADAQISSAANLQIMQNSQNAKDQQNSGSNDKAFLKKVLQGNLSVTESSQLAVQKTTSPQVKQLAQHLIDDHASLGDTMTPLAGQLGVKTPTEPAKKDKAMIASLQGLSGDAFDKAYVKYMLQDHEADAAAFKQETTSGKLPQVKDAAAKATPVIDTHLQMIRGVAKELNVDSTM